MIKQIKDLFKYLILFQSFLGKSIYLIFIFSLVASVLEGFGILMVLPLFESIDQSQNQESTSQFVLIVYDLIEFFGMSASVTSIIIFIVLVFILKGIVNFFALGMIARLMGKLLLKLKANLYENYSNMTYKYYTLKDTGQFINLINEQPNRAINAFQQITIMFGNLISFIILMFLAFSSAWNFALMALIFGLIVVILFVKLNSYVRSLSRITATENGILNKWMIQALQSFKYLNATNQMNLLKSRILRSIDILTNNQIKTGVASAFTQSVREPVAVVFIMSLIFVQIVILNQEFEPIIVSIILFYRALGSMLGVQSFFQGTFQYIGSLELISSEFNDQIKHKKNEGKIELGKLHNSIELNKINFSYNESELVFKDLSIKFNANSSIAIVGDSGSGKSTIVNIISLLLEPNSGQLLIDGIDSKSIIHSSWKNQIGYVSQETVIFDDTIKNNISMWNSSNLDDKQLQKKIKSSARDANILDFIESLPNGFETYVGDRGVQLSGGQRQRIFIARELFRNPRLLILDEATSSLDSVSEKEIQRSIDSLKGKITIIIIAHRLSTIKNVDKIFTVGNGSLIEEGTYFDLISSDSYFKRITDLQKL
tara:strand:+ start:13107 stop:14903 length:1797 start_codon:yes stop_codon:yes gene_type:complete